tara:strand:+ start:193 stop:465 length:273 start_codon:yes stop_codon:yes gene_type:complete
MISVEVENHDDPEYGPTPVVNLIITADEIDQLIVDLQSLQKSRSGSSLHLFSSAWGNGDLSVTQLFNGSNPVHHFHVLRTGDPKDPLEDV